MKKVFLIIGILVTLISCQGIDEIPYPNSFFEIYLELKENKVESSENAIASFLKKQYDLDDNYALKTKRESSSIDIKSQRMVQYYKGIEIAFSDIFIISKNNNVEEISGIIYDIKQLNTIPKLSENKSLNIFRKKINSWINPASINLKLVIFSKNLVNDGVFELDFDDILEPALAYKFNTYGANTDPIGPSTDAVGTDYYIDAINGEILFKNSFWLTTAPNETMLSMDNYMKRR